MKDKSDRVPLHQRRTVPTHSHLPPLGKNGDHVFVEDERCGYVWMNGGWHLFEPPSDLSDSDDTPTP